MTQPRILKNFSVFVNGQGYSGQCEEAELPDFEIKMEDWRGGGMDGTFEVDMGQEAMNAKLTFAEPLPAVITALMKGTRIQLRGSYVRDLDQSRVAVLVELGARPKKFAPGSWKAGDKGSNEHELAVDYYRWVQGSEELFEIDVVNMIRRVGGVDQLAGIRNDLAL